MRTLFLLIISLTSALAWAAKPATTVCRSQDFKIEYQGGEAAMGSLFATYYLLKNLSQKTCVIRGYRASIPIDHFQDYDGKTISNKSAQIWIQIINNDPPLTLKPQQALTFTMGFSGPSYGNANAYLGQFITLRFKGITGRFVIKSNVGGAVSDIQFEKLETP